MKTFPYRIVPTHKYKKVSATPEPPIPPPFQTSLDSDMFPRHFETTVYTEQLTVCPSDLMLNFDPFQATGSAQASSYNYHWQYTLAPAAIQVDAVECVHYVNNSYCDILYSLRSRFLCQ